jgi:hypothetical protein
MASERAGRHDASFEGDIDGCEGRCTSAKSAEEGSLTRKVAEAHIHFGAEATRLLHAREIGEPPLYNHLEGRRGRPQLRKDNGSLKLAPHRLLGQRRPST